MPSKSEMMSRRHLDDDTNFWKNFSDQFLRFISFRALKVVKIWPYDLAHLLIGIIN